MTLHLLQILVSIKANDEEIPDCFTQNQSLYSGLRGILGHTTE